MPEIWDAYDKELNKIDNVQLIRGEPIPDGLYHLVCDIVVKHTDGTYLLMQRDFKKTFGGMWELTAGGSALAGETPLEGAMRELREETGIISFDLKEIERFVNEKRHFVCVVHFCLTDCDKNSIILQKGETVAFRWLTRDEILEMSDDTLAPTRALKILSCSFMP